ncbi:MAG TPA: hypothetical protein VGM19_09655 [Armatimonadota bacterium]|jgi:hypothetical protein
MRFHVALAASLVLLTLLPSAEAAAPLLVVGREGQPRTAVCTPGGITKIIEIFSVHLPAGETELVGWGPDLPAKVDTLTLTPAGARVVRWREEPTLGGRAWTVAADAAGDYQMAIFYDLPQLTTKLSYRLDWEDGHGSLRVFLRLTNGLPQPLALAGAEYAMAGAAGALGPAAFRTHGALVLPPGVERVEEVAVLADLAGERVYEYDGGAVHERLELALTPAQLATWGALAPGDLSVADPVTAERLPLAVGPLPGPAQGKVAIALRDTADVVVRRTLVREAKTVVDFDTLRQVTGSDLTEEYRLEVRNYTPEAITVRLWEMTTAAWELTSPTPVARTEGNRLAYEVRPQAGDTSLMELTVVKHSGTRAQAVAVRP